MLFSSRRYHNGARQMVYMVWKEGVMTSSRCVSLKIFVLLSLVVLVSCGDDGDPVKPDFQFPATMESLWPHADGNYWTFQLTDVVCREYDGGHYDSLQDVPPIPSLDVLYSRLKEALFCEEDERGSGTLVMEFDGEVEVTPEITAQDLKSQAHYDVCCVNPPLALYPRLWLASEDKIVGYFVWETQADTNWVYLTADLETGAQFSQAFPLPYGADLLFKGKIWRHLRYNMPDGSWANAVECFYLLDQGIQQATDHNGNVIGYFHSFIFGVVIYAENVGPVFCREQYGTTGPVGTAPGAFPVSRDKIAVLAE